MWPDPQKTADLVTFTEESRNGKLLFFCSGLRQMDEWALEVGIMSGDFKLRIFLSGLFVFVCCVFFNKRMLCFYSMQSAWELLGMVVLIQWWTQVIDYLLPRLTRLTRLRISMSHLSISGMIVRGRYYNSHCFFFCYFLWLLVGWSFFLFLFSCLLIVVWGTKNPF